MMKNKPFDCVEMKHKAQEAIQAKLAAMTPEEEAAYWAKRNEELREEVKAIQEQRKAS